jgi:hypothetical protein
LALIFVYYQQNRKWSFPVSESDISFSKFPVSRHLLKLFYEQGFQSGPVPGTFTRLRSCIVPAEITEPPKISGGQNHKYDRLVDIFHKKLMITSIAEFSHSNLTTASRPS